MATRILLRRKTDVGTTFVQIGDDITPPSALRWTLVELRIALSGAGAWRLMYNEELYCEGRQELDFGLKGKPHIIAMDVVYPHKIVLMSASDTGTVTVNAEITVEETPYVE